MRWSLLLLFAGCGRVGFDETTSAPIVGELDPAFGDGGIAHPSNGVRGESWDVGVRGTGYLMNGVTFPNASDVYMDVLALTEAGVPDPAWPGGGEQLLGPVPSSFGYGVTMLAGGGAFVVGDGAIGAEQDNFVIGKLTPQGTLDPTFGGDGFVDYNIPPTTNGDTAWQAVLVGTTLYVCGVASYGNDPRITVIAVRASDGQLDAGFATAGVSTTNVTLQGDECRDIAFDGSLLVVTGRVGNMITVMTYDLSGSSVDRLTMMQGSGRGLALTPDGGRIIVASSGSGGYLMRLAGGALDPAFGTGGLVAVPDTFLDVALDVEGRIVAAGHRDANPVIARFLADGAPDPTFAEDGVFLMPISGDLYGVAIDPQGRIVAVGYDDESGPEHPLVVRLH